MNMLDNGASLSRIARVLAAYLVETRQTRHSDLYLRDIRRQLAQRFGHLAADVQSARGLSGETDQQIDNFLKQQTGARQIELIKEIDKSLIGGVVISTTDAEMDASIRGKLQKLRRI
jgi:F-type H+-transporting ATPase subunit delta